MATQTNLKDLMYRVNDELWSEGTLDFIDEYVDPDYVEHNNASPEPVRGREGYRENIQMVRTAFPDLDVTTEHIVFQGDLAFNHYTITGTHDGPFMGIEPTGNDITVTGMSLGRFEDGRVVEGWTNADVFGMMQQLGLVDAPGR